MEQETACLILNTFDINPSNTVATYFGTTTDNQYGTITNNKCNLTWKNINMRQILGTMYDKYETFNLCLYHVSQGVGLAVDNTLLVRNTIVDIRIKGLQFLNNGYSITSRNNTNSAFLTSFILNHSNNGANNSGTLTQLINPAIITFGKSADCVDINIDMRSIFNQDYPPIILNTALGTFTFNFKIYGIPKRDENIILNGSRM